LASRDRFASDTNASEEEPLEAAEV
jgi:hypothetical protein